jgi:hypothetical protein
MTLTGIMAILVGWLMILPLHHKNHATAPAHSRRWLRYVLAVIGTSVLTAGMASVVQGGF